MILSAYRLILWLCGPFLVLLLALRRVQGLEEKGHASEKTGRASLPRPFGPVIWVHAASNGEMLSSLPLVKKILDANADAVCLITTVTVTAARLVRRQNNPRILHQYAPLDHPLWVNRFMDHWRPNAVFWVESELWPETLSDIHARRIPLIMVNGRMSPRSAARWSKIPATIQTILSWFDVSLAQTADDAQRLRDLGAVQVIEAGNIKYAAAPLHYETAALQTLQDQIGARPMLLLASTHAGEEEIAVDVYKALCVRHSDVLVIVMPRHPARGDEIMKIFAGCSLKIARRSAGDAITPETQIYLADTLGEAGLFYRLCPIAFVGNSLITEPGGGHNLLEPAHLGAAILHGPHMWNFTEIERDLRAAGGSVTVRDADDLAVQASTLIDDPKARKALADAAQTFVQAQDRVLEDVIHHIHPVLVRAGVAL